MKQEYAAPALTSTPVPLEQDIAISSGMVIPHGRNDVISIWETEQDESRTLEHDW